MRVVALVAAGLLAVYLLCGIFVALKVRSLVKSEGGQMDVVDFVMVSVLWLFYVWGAGDE